MLTFSVAFLVTSGATAIIDSLIFALCDPGDAVLVSSADCMRNDHFVILRCFCIESPVLFDHIIMKTLSPYYGAFDKDVCIRTGVELISAPMHPPTFHLEVTTLEETYSQATAAGKKVKVVQSHALMLSQICVLTCLTFGLHVKILLIVNPNNPMGDIYSPELIADVMSWCRSHQLHFVSDELYMHSGRSVTIRS